MKLTHLKTACYLYNQFTDYDSTYLELRQRHPHLNLGEERQVRDLLKWLRSWGCRQFKTDDEDMSVQSIVNWYKLHESAIPSEEESLVDYDLAKNESLISCFFSDLSRRKAGTRHRSGIDFDVGIGPVGAAKTLFALRPNLFSPWDTPIYQYFHLEGDGNGYVSYLCKIQSELRDIEVALCEASIDWSDLLSCLKKHHNSYPKLVDEYFWVTITKGCDPIEIETIFR